MLLIMPIPKRIAIVFYTFVQIYFRAKCDCFCGWHEDCYGRAERGCAPRTTGTGSSKYWTLFTCRDGPRARIYVR